MNDTRKKHILFVCVENSNRSQMAEAFARYHGGSTVEAYSSGSRPSGVINPKAIIAMKKRDIDLNSHRSKGLNELPSITWDYVITMGCGDQCPMLQTCHREDWELPDPRNMEAAEFNKVRDEIERRVIALLKLLNRQN